MKKEDVFNEYIKCLESDFIALKGTYELNKKNAQDSEMKAESKWDTRSIEAGYLASAQEAKLKEKEAELNILKNFKLKSFNEDDPINVGALIELYDEEILYFLLPISGGKEITLKGTIIKAISPKSPLGRSLIGAYTSDACQYKTPKGEIEVEVKLIL